MAKQIPVNDNQIISMFEFVFMAMIAIGFMALVNYVVFLYPQAGILLVGVGCLLLLLAKAVRRKKNIPRE